MEYRALGTSDLKISAVTLGAWAIGGFMWGGTDDDDAIAAIRRSIDLGVTTIDTAPVYGMGHSEELVGKAVAGRREKVQILTKYSMQWDGKRGTFKFPDPEGNLVTIYRDAAPQRIIQECEDSLRRLGTDYIDLYQQHQPDANTPLQESMQDLAALLKQGKIRAAGVSNFSVELIESARQILPIASDQPPYSMINRGIEKDVLPYCRANNIGVIVYSPLQRGLLTGAVTLDRSFPPTDHRSTNPFFKLENRKRILLFLDQIRPVADAHNATLAQLVINWTIHRPGITAALVGARNPAQASENAAAASFTLSAAETARIDSHIEDLKLEL